MKNMVRIIMVFTGVAVWCTTASAQEQLLPLRYNTEIFNHQEPANVRSAVELPFIDDFSYPGPDPDPLLWENNGGWLNVTFPKDPITYGVLSLDGLDSHGIPYDPTSFSFSSVDSADTITSVPVLLGSLSALDTSVYFSFFYQSGGVGDPSNTQPFNLFNYGVVFGDSLVLEFKDNAGVWKHVWAHDGETVQPFKQVLIPITDPEFFHDAFQFRFWNYATVIGNYDQWHIDYVRLNKGRNKFDTLIADVAVQRYPTSILKTYQAMPWKQFQNYQDKEKADHHFLAIKNNFNAVKNTSYRFDAVEKVSGLPIFSSNVQSQNIGASDTAYVAFNAFDIPDFNSDSVIISTRYIVGATGDNNTRNDTIVRDQLFYNYMAYDDGSAEATYRLLGSPASLALQYIVNEPDTLQGVAIHFSNTDENMSQNLFSLIVWSSLDPEDTLYRDDFLKPKYTEELNGFILYRLSRPLVVTDTFYIGFQQTSVVSDLKTDIGFDVNTDGSDHLFYNINGNWNNSGFNGSLMMRPLLGKSIPFQVGIDEPAINDAGIIIYPNPVNDVLIIQCENITGYRFEILDNAGRLLQKVVGQKSISVAKLATGFYLLKATQVATGNTSIHKFIKQ